MMHTTKTSMFRRSENKGSWYGWISAGKGTYLLGGVTRVTSSRFGTREDAAAWVAQAVEANCAAGRLPMSWGETWSPKAPEIGELGAWVRGVEVPR